MSHTCAIPLFVLAALIGALNAAPARADDPSCNPVANAMMKEASTPFHEMVVSNGKSFEKIYTPDAVYLGMDGHWTKLATHQEILESTRKSLATLSNCKMLRTDTIDGQRATVYAMHVQSTSAISSDGQIWIGANGLPLKTESDTQIPGTSKMHTSEHMTFGNVQAPAGAH